jgi:hypothetical protein
MFSWLLSKIRPINGVTFFKGAGIGEDLCENLYKKWEKAGFGYTAAEKRKIIFC